MCVFLYNFLFEFLCRQKGIVQCTHVYVCMVYIYTRGDTVTHMYAPKNKTKWGRRRKRARHKHITRLHTHTKIGSSHAVSSLVCVVWHMLGNAQTERKSTVAWPYERLECIEILNHPLSLSLSKLCIGRGRFQLSTFIENQCHYSFIYLFTKGLQ